MMNLENLLEELEAISPLSFAESWDNVGLLTAPTYIKKIKTILFTIDLTENVYEDAVSCEADMIYSYHPPIFSPMKSLNVKNWKQRIILSCIEKGVAIFSPHTALDAVEGGINDWIISCFELSVVAPIQKHLNHNESKYLVVCKVPEEYDLQEIINIPKSKITLVRIDESIKTLEIEVLESSMAKLISLLEQDKVLFSLQTQPSFLETCGMGRTGALKKPMMIKDVILCVKIHMGLQNLRVSFGNKHSLDSAISTIAVCAGSGSKVLSSAPADLYITGEMSHHDLLNAAHEGTTVLLCEHSNSERGFLQKLISLLQPKLKGVNLLLSNADKDPVTVM